CIFIGCLIKIVFNTILIPTNGGIGAAIATVVAYAFAGYISCLSNKSLWKTFRMLTLSILTPLRIHTLMNFRGL
ncbi:MAG: polysaccharide biosynthesis C-terminal domain-containing protein, partial [Leptolyngbyaceae cyanobacterium]